MTGWSVIWQEAQIAGKVINLTLVNPQYDGNVIYGLGSTLLEETIFGGVSLHFNTGEFVQSLELHINDRRIFSVVGNFL